MAEKITYTSIQHLAELARIAVSEEEAQQLATEIEGILQYVEQVQEVAAGIGTTPAAGVHRNIMREDVETHAPGEYSEVLLDAAPERHGRYVHVKKVVKKGQDNG